MPHFYCKIGALQFNYLSYKLFLEKYAVRLKKKVDFGVLRTKMVLEFSVRLQEKKVQVLRIFIVRVIINQLQEFISAVVEPQV